MPVNTTDLQPHALDELSPAEYLNYAFMLIWEPPEGERLPRPLPSDEQVIMRAAQAQGEDMGLALKQYRRRGNIDDLDRAEAFLHRAIALLARMRRKEN